MNQKGSPRFAVEAGFVPILILVGILIITGLIGGAYYLGTRKPASVVPSPTPVVTSSPSDVSPVPTDTGETANPDLIGANWKTYTNTKYRYSFKHPLEAKIKESKESLKVVLELWGDKQKDVAEGIIDGLSMTFSEGNLNSKTLKDFVTEKAKEEQQPNQLITPSLVSINGIKGYSFNAYGQSLNNFIFLSNGIDSYIEIIYYTEGSSQEIFEEQAKQILSTFRFD